MLRHRIDCNFTSNIVVIGFLKNKISVGYDVRFYIIVKR